MRGPTLVSSNQFVTSIDHIACAFVLLVLLVLLLLLLRRAASLQPTCGGPPQLDEQKVSATACIVSSPRVCYIAAVDRLCFCARMVGKRVLECA